MQISDRRQGPQGHIRISQKVRVRGATAADQQLSETYVLGDSIAGWLLLAYSVVGLRIKMRRRFSELSSCHGNASTPTAAATENG